MNEVSIIINGVRYDAVEVENLLFNPTVSKTVISLKGIALVVLRLTRIRFSKNQQKLLKVENKCIFIIVKNWNKLLIFNTLENAFKK